MVEPAEIFAGRPTVLIFMRTDCPISNRYAPVIEKLFQTYGLRVRFWLVYPDAKETAAQISAHQKEFHLSAAPLRDIHLRLASLAGATMTPEAAVFNRGARLIYHGRIDNLYIDATRARANPTSNDLEDAIRASLAGKSVTPDHTAAVGCYIADVAEKPAP
ncbi:MAG TPA: hypothetical protein VMT51_03990 [Dongiaceae bacterium]|nr:hypothetical protein [Dongiaceae bacterium]